MSAITSAQHVETSTLQMESAWIVLAQIINFTLVYVFQQVDAEVDNGQMTQEYATMLVLLVINLIHQLEIALLVFPPTLFIMPKYAVKQAIMRIQLENVLLERPL